MNLRSQTSVWLPRLLLSLAATAASIHAQTTVGNSNPREFATLNAGGPTLFFAASTQTAVELYRKPGFGMTSMSPLATFPIAAGLSGPSELTSAAGGSSSLAFFAADDGSGLGDEPWVSDGTVVGTNLLLDLATGSASSRPQYFFSIAPDVTLFVADDGINGRELWVTDGTPSGTNILLDIFPGPTGSFPLDFVRVGNEAWFSATDPVHGRELWRTDGSPGNATLVADVLPGPVGSFPHELTVVGPNVLFAADDELLGTELWSTEIPTLVTTLVADIRLGPVGSRPRELTTVEVFGTPTLAFVADDGLTGAELWMSDSTGPGTTLFADIWPGPLSSTPQSLVTDSSRLWFAADDGSNGAEPWTADFSAGAASIVDDVRPGPEGSMPQRFLVRTAGEVLLTADDGVTGEELWSIFGPGPAMQLQDLRPGICGAGITSLAVDRISGLVHFAADPGAGVGHELFETDGTPGGTIASPQINPMFDNQPSLDIGHLVQSGQINNVFKIAGLTAAEPTFLLFGGLPGPPIDLGPILGVQTIGQLEVDLNTFAVSLGPVLADQDGSARFPVPYQIQGPAFEVLTQGLSFDAMTATLKLTGNTTLCQGTLDLSSGTGCPPGTTVELIGEYVDDRLDYCLTMKPSSAAVTWVVFVKVFADGSCKEIKRCELSGGKSTVTLVKSLKLGEYIEARFYCGKPDDDCATASGFVACRLGC